MTKTSRKNIRKDRTSSFVALRPLSRYYLRPSKDLSFTSKVEKLLTEDEYITFNRKEFRKRKVPFTRLPEEIVIKILSNLSVKELNVSIAPVCRKWFLYSRLPSLWRELRFEGDSISTHKVCSLLRLAPQLRRLEIIYRSDITALLKEVCQSNRRLEQIIIKQNFNPITSRLSPYAINFSINSSSFDWQSVESIFMDNSLLYVPIDPKEHSNVPAYLLLKVLRSCRRLNTITLIGIEMRSRCFFETLVLLPKLQSIDLTVGNRPGALNWAVTLLKSHIGEGTRSAPLYFQAIYNWYNQEIEERVPSRVHMTNSRYIMGVLTPTITVLDLDAIAISEDMFDSVIKCASLEALHLYNALNITSTVVIRMLTELPQLVSLIINQAYRLRSAVLTSTFCNSVNNMGSENKTSKLKYLSMVECPAIDDASIHALTSRNPQLEHLCLAQCHRLTDEGLRCVLWFCHRLRSINLWDCSGLVGRTLMYVPKCAPNLQFLMVGNSRGSRFSDDKTEKHVNSLKEAMPQIEIHDSKTLPKGWTPFRRN